MIYPRVTDPGLCFLRKRIAMSQIPPTPIDPQANSNAKQPGEHGVPPPKRARRKWVWIVGGILVALLLLVILAPTIASTAPVRSFIVGKINNNLTGRVAIADWSLGWFSGIRASGIQVFDERNVLILDVPRIKTDLSLVNAARGNLHVGDAVVDVANFVLRIDQSGKTNFEKLQRSTPKPAPAPETTDLPNLRGKVTVNFQGSVESPDRPTVHINPSTAVVDISSVNQPVKNEVKLVYRVGDGQPGTVQTSGSLDVAENNQLQVEKLSADQKLSLSSVDLVAISPFLQGTQLGGIANGALDLKAQSLAGISANGQIIVDSLAIGGEALNGDTFRSSKVTLPVQVTRTPLDSNSTLIKIEKLGIEMPEATVAVTGQVPESALLNLLDNKAPGAEGKLQLSINVENIAAIANQLRNTIKLQEGVELTAGKLTQVSSLDIQPKELRASQTVDVSAQGSNRGRSIALKPIHIESALVMVPTGKPMPELRDIKLLLQSDFAQLKGTGQTIAQLNITSDFDLQKLSSELGQFVEMPQQLSGNGRLALTTRGDLTQQSQPIDADLKVNLFPAGQTQRSLVDLDATAKLMPADNSVPEFELKTLTVNDLNQLQQQFGALVPALAEQKILLASGRLQATAAGSYGSKGLALSKPISVTMSNVTMSREGKPVLENESIKATVDGVRLDNDAVVLASAQIQSPFATTTMKDTRVLLEGSPLEMVESADVQARIADVPKLWRLVSTFAPPTEGEQPLEITSGGASIALKIRRTGETTTVELTDALVSKLALKRGDREYRFDRDNPISVKLNADVTGKDEPQTIKVKSLQGDLRVASLSMPQPISISDLAGNPTASGAIAATGSLKEITPLLAVLNGTDEMPYSGEFAINQHITSDANNVILVGDVTTKQFQVFEKPDRKNLLFSEQEVAIRNDLALDQKKQLATIKSLSIDMPASKAVAVNLTGGVQDWTTQRSLKNVKLDLTYDLAKLWPVIKPMLAPETQEQLKDLKIAGQYTKQFVAAGSYPRVDRATGRELEWYESIRTIDAHGSLSVQLFDTSGLKVENLEIPINLDKGQLAIVYAGKSKAERLPKPATCNGGTLDIGGAVVDLSQETLRLSIGKNQRLLRGVSINPLLGDSLGKYVNPIFTNSQRAKGLLDLTVNYCEGLALGEKLKSSESGRARVVFSIQEMEIANPLGSLMLGAIPGLSLGKEADTFEGSIKDAVVTIEGGRTTQDVTLLLTDPSAAQQAAAGKAPPQTATMPLRFQGDVNLANLAQSIEVSLPTGLLGKFLRSDKDRRVFAQIFPDGVPLSLKGTTIKPKVDAGNIVQKIAEGQIKGLLGGDVADSPLGGLLDNLGKKKEQDRKK